jgi:glycyl-tRNA synthetase beta chain
MALEFLLEVGCEEIPSGWFQPPVDLRAGLQRSLHALLEEQRILGGAVEVHATPRRFAARADVLERQPGRTVAAWGPPLSAARDGTGAWTKAARGFAGKLGVEPEALLARRKDPARSEEYLVYDRREEGQASSALLPGVVGAALRSLAFPKRMSWDAWLEDGKGSLPFGRPIRWIVALLGGDVVPFTIHVQEAEGAGGVLLSSGRATRGHRFLPRGAGGVPFPVDSFAALKDGLRDHFVLLDTEERLHRIREALAPWGKDVLGHPLVAEWAELVEHPAVVFGTIPGEFRSLPAEVLETVLVHHQRYIPVSEGRGAPSRFAALTDAEPAAAPVIVKGLERVVIARLRDATFFFAEDMKRPLEDRVADLQGVTFHEGLGSYRDKTDRMVRLVDAMASEMGILTKTEHEAARKAARLAKADLTTLMVREFPELQGIMGSIYLVAQGEPWENVARAVRWHYAPASIEEGSPPAQALSGSDATVFAAVSLADKLDTLAGYFGLGLEPTGSSDPFGLRRSAQGIIRVVLDFWHADREETRPDLKLLCARAAQLHPRLKRPPEEIAQALSRFLRERLLTVLVARGFPQEEVEAVLDSPLVDPLSDPFDALVRLKSLHAVRASEQENFSHLATAFKRAKNILSQGSPSKVDPRLFADAAEGGLHEAVVALSHLDGPYEARLMALAGLRGPVDRFFDEVLVMAEDQKVRGNRLGLLKDTLSLFYQVADISKLGG